LLNNYQINWFEQLFVQKKPGKNLCKNYDLTLEVLTEIDFKKVIQTS